MNKSFYRFIAISSAIAIAGCSNLATSSQVQLHPIPHRKLETKMAINQPCDYHDYAEVLQSYVDERGLVNYEGLKADRQQLDRFNKSLGKVTPEQYNSWNEPDKIAFLINAYNAFTLQSIIDQDPLKDSIRDIPGVWKKRTFTLAGEQKTLDNIEHDILRKDFNEPRLHVALVCAAKSCPPLRNEPYLPEQLDAQLEDQTAQFVASPHGFRLEQQAQKVYLSSIFKWYGKDFEETYGIDDQFDGNAKQRAVLNYLSTQLNPEARQYLENGDYQVEYLDYDWSLNKQ
ncbi:DUF547 domain-containing protein [Pleurocapsa sp. PCC 7319]|uniref:DUF547 domain-containing protein n=1 Tax=Pleurocapsa sp. PCC 7319 TaxID=118161 RepID=UPI00034BAB06|nr:DUF547 domain-containing protein [Pleurocapsa sp. PCC 7319]